MNMPTPPSLVLLIKKISTQQILASLQDIYPGANTKGTQGGLSSKTSKLYDLLVSHMVLRQKFYRDLTDNDDMSGNYIDKTSA